MLNIKHLLTFTTLVAVWGLAYAVNSAWVGTAIVSATTAVYVAFNVEAMRTRKAGLLVFSLAGMAWMIFWLGFIAETKRTTHWGVPEIAFNMVHFGTPPDYNAAFTPDKMIVDTTLHSLHGSFDSGRMKNPDERVIPAYPTAIRLAVSVTSVIFGILISLASLFTPSHKTSAG